MKKNSISDRILIGLAKYKFLTYKQMIRLGIGTKESNLSKEFKKLMARTRPLATKFVRKEPTDNAIHYLTSYGKKYLVVNHGMEESDIKYLPKKKDKDNLSAKHRTATIDCQIGLSLSYPKKKVSLIFCDVYFDKVDENPFNKRHKSQTAISVDKNNTVKADIVFMLETSKQQELYFLEVENGDDTKKAVEKCTSFGKAIYYGQANKKYNFHRGFRTLWVFEKSTTMRNTIKRLASNPYFEELTEYFLFNTLESIQNNDFFSNWVNIKSQPRKLFYK